MLFGGRTVALPDTLLHGAVEFSGMFSSTFSGGFPVSHPTLWINTESMTALSHIGPITKLGFKLEHYSYHSSLLFHQRKAAHAMFKPPPEAHITTICPRSSFPSRTASSKTIGMQAEPV